MIDPEFIELAKLAVAWEKAHAVYFPASAKDMAEIGAAILKEEGIQYWISPRGDAITCVECRMTSFNKNDVASLYCGHCHRFHTLTRAGDGEGE